MTKLDGTARGGILAAIAAKYRLPVHFIGVGEGIDDLAPFAARDFARALAGADSAAGRFLASGLVEAGILTNLRSFYESPCPPGNWRGAMTRDTTIVLG